MRAALLMLGSTMAFGLMAVAIRYATRYVPTQEVAFFRNAFGLLALLPMLLRRGRAPLRTQQLPRYFVRSAIGLGSMLCAFWALGHLPLAQAVSLSYSTPLFVTIAAVLWLGETVRVRRWAAVVVGFIGVLVIVRPGTAGFTAGSLVAVAAAVLSSLVAIQIKQLTRVDSADTVVLYTYVFWVPLSLVPALFVWVWPTGLAWLWLLATGVLGVLLLTEHPWALAQLERRAMPDTLLPVLGDGLLTFAIALATLIVWLRVRRAATLVLLAHGMLWMLYGLVLIPALDPYASASAVMRRVGARIGPDAELALVAWREQNLLQADRPVREFGFKRPWAEQWHDAGPWLAEAPDKRWLLVLDEAMSPCVDPAKVIDIGIANRNRWQLLPGSAWNPECHAERTGSTADED